MMNRLRVFLMSGCWLLLFALPVFAQEQAKSGITDDSFKYLAAGLGMAIAAAGAAIGDSKAISAACEGVARNPGAGGRLQTLMLIGVVFIETLVLFTFAMIYIKLP
jgi:F-type H+-transporting ATPase subunit c